MKGIYKAIDTKKVKNLTLEGGGVAGIGYCGALDVLKEQGILDQIERVAGTSAGAMCSLALAVGCTPEEIKKLLLQLDFKQFQDDKIGVIRDLHTIIHEFGLYQGEVILNWLGDLIEEKVKSLGYDRTISFKQLHEERLRQLKETGKTNLKDIYLVATNVTQRKKEVFSYENQNYQDLPIALGARCSMSIPFAFKSVKLSISSEPIEQVFVDGGCIANDPQGVFDDLRFLPGKSQTSGVQSDENHDPNYKFNRETMALRLDTKREIEAAAGKDVHEDSEVSNLVNFGMGIVDCLQEGQFDGYVHSKKFLRTIVIDRNDIAATKFDITNKEKQALIDNGRKATQQFIKRNNERAALHKVTKEAKAAAAANQAFNIDDVLAKAKSVLFSKETKDMACQTEDMRQKPVGKLVSDLGMGKGKELSQSSDHTHHSKTRHTHGEHHRRKPRTSGATSNASSTSSSHTEQALSNKRCTIS